jgi:hypothetical protein
MRHVPDDFQHLPTVDEDAVEDIDSLRRKPTPADTSAVLPNVPDVVEENVVQEVVQPWEQPTSAEPGPTAEYEPPTVRVHIRKRGIIETSPPPDAELEVGPGPRDVLRRPAPPQEPARPKIMQPAPSTEGMEELGTNVGKIAHAQALSPAIAAAEHAPAQELPSSIDEPASSAKADVTDEPGPVFKPPGSLTAGDTPGADDVPKDSLKERWEKWGGRSLVLSVGIHLALLILGALIVVHQTMDSPVDFLSGGGSVQGEQAAAQLQHKIQQKKNPWLKQSMPMRKLAVESAITDVVLPTDVPDMLDIPQSNKLGGGMMSGGFGLAGAGAGFGKGLGIGGANGMVFGPLFGLNIRAKKLAVVLDVSSSMAPHLERVVKEVDKVAKGSVVVLYFGCGLEPPPKTQLSGTRVFRTSSVDFEKFWRMGGATMADTAKFKIDPTVPISMESVYLTLAKRPQTYFIHHVGVSYTWLALLSEEVRSADGLYWFSDFQDTVEFKQASIVLENLQRRKQRLYIHSYGKGQYFDFVKNQIVAPTKGDSYVEE